MSCRVAKRKCVGVSCGRKCGICVIALLILLLLVSIGYSLTARLYYKVYYTSAHVAAICAVTSLFALCHHMIPIQSALCCEFRGFYITQSILNLIYLACCTVLCVGYILLSIIELYYNFDYIASAGFAGLSAMVMFYLCAMTLSSSKKGRSSDYEVDIKFVWQTDSTGVQSDMVLHDSSVDLHKPHSTGDKCTCKACCSVCCKIIFGLIYGLFQFIVIILFVASAARPVFLALDINSYRDGDYLYKVDIHGHYPLALSLRCTGNGNETILLENDAGVTYYMQWEYLPQLLKDDFRVCMYNRRGYGWSQSFENDDVMTDLKGTKWRRDQADLLHELLRKSNINTPVYYVAHGYGTHIMTQMAVDYPDVIKALIYIDGNKAMSLDTDYMTIEAMCNIHGFSQLDVLTRTSWYDLTQYLPALDRFDKLPDSSQNKIEADIRQSYYFPSYRREKEEFNDDDLKNILGDNTIDLPVLVIDAHCDSSAWFSAENFERYREELYVSNKDVSHEDIMFHEAHVQNTSAAIRTFIRYVRGDSTGTLTSLALRALSTC